MESRNDSIVEKIKGLLALANDHKNDEECQTAFLMAQKLMIKYDISISEVENQAEKSVTEGQVTAHKILFWWERQLANIITENFRTTWYFNNKKFKGDGRRKSAIIFMGFKSDVELAKEMYVLAYDVLVHYVKDFVDQHYIRTGYERHRQHTEGVKNSYIRGFLNGLNEKFEDQVKEMEQEYGLMVLLPEEVKRAYDEMFEGKKSRRRLSIPPIEELEAYQKGYHDGNKVDYTKSTLDEGVFV